MGLLQILFQNPLEFLVIALILVITISIHEFSHAYVADRLGDPTPRIDGRLTLNPLAHLDMWGTLLLLTIGLGWGKPVMFDPYNLRNPRRDAALISLAGPASNFILAAIASILLRFVPIPFGIGLILEIFIKFSLLLGVFNLIPVHPLDGFKVVTGFLPRELALEWESLEKYGLFLLIFLIFPIFGGDSVVGIVITPIINLLTKIFTGY